MVIVKCKDGIYVEKAERKKTAKMTDLKGEPLETEVLRSDMEKLKSEGKRRLLKIELGR